MSLCTDHGKNTDKYGYSRKSAKVYGRWRSRLLHRLVYAEANGLVEWEMQGVVLHKCDNPRCINPDHLVLGTQLDNVEDMRRKGRASRGTHRPLAKLSEKDILGIRQATGTQRAIARQYGIGQAQVSRIKRGAQWAGLDNNGRWIGKL